MKRPRFLLDILADLDGGKTRQEYAEVIVQNHQFRRELMRDWADPDYEFSETEKLAIEIIMSRS